MARYLVLLLLTALAPAVAAEPPELVTQRVAGCLCAPLPAVATALRAQVQQRDDGRLTRLTVAPRWLELRRGSVLATTPSGPLLLPMCPYLVDQTLYVPVAAVAAALGGSTTDAAGTLDVIAAGQTVLRLPQPAPDEVRPAGRDQLAGDLADPRVDLTERLEVLATGARGRYVLDRFLKAAEPAVPVLEGLGTSKSLRLLSRVPLVGALLGVLQDTAGTLGESVRLGHKVAAYDESSWAPLRRGLEAARDLPTNPTATDLATAREAWQAALPAVSSQLDDLQAAATKARLLQLGLRLLDTKLAAVQEEYPKLPLDLATGTVKSLTAQFVTWTEATAWDRRTLREYFQRLLADLAPANP
ncbi:MAG: hypothetical protein IT204_05225 [Fimbriimonadaceae bacterium]|nr:hypothetical protein [Fimbriimonadaceae bacterium]